MNIVDIFIKEAALGPWDRELAKEIAKEINATKPPLNMKKSFGIVGATIIVAMAAQAMLEYLRTKVAEPKRYKELFEKMLERHPQLMNEKPEELAELWHTVYRTSPTLAEDPVAAGATITQLLQKQVLQEYGGPTLDVYQALNSIEKGLLENRDTRNSTWGKFFQNSMEGTKSLGATLGSVAALSAGV